MGVTEPHGGHHALLCSLSRKQGGSLKIHDKSPSRGNLVGLHQPVSKEVNKKHPDEDLMKVINDI